MSPLSAEQMAMRRTGITGTDVAALCGLSPYRTPLDVWKSKVTGEEKDETDAMAVGNALEPVILRKYQRRFGVTLLPSKTLRHPQFPLIIATPDAIHPEGFPVEAKNTERFEDWGPDSTDEVPEHYKVQSLWQQAILGAPHGDMMALFGRYDFRWYRLQWDEEYFQALRVIAERFHRDHVVTKKPPDPDGSEAWSDFIKERFPFEKGPMLEADSEAERLAEEYLKADVTLEAAELAKRLARQSLELRIGEAAGMVGQTWKVSWKSTRPISKVDWEACARSLGATDAVTESFTSTKPGYRPFRLTRVKQRES